MILRKLSDCDNRIQSFPQNLPECSILLQKKFLFTNVFDNIICKFIRSFTVFLGYFLVYARVASFEIDTTFGLFRICDFFPHRWIESKQIWIIAFICQSIIAKTWQTQECAQNIQPRPFHSVYFFSHKGSNFITMGLAIRVK